jgi:hypothetical protein
MFDRTPHNRPSSHVRFRTFGWPIGTIVLRGNRSAVIASNQTRATGRPIMRQRCPHGIDHSGWCQICQSESAARFLHPSVPRLATTETIDCPACGHAIPAGAVTARVDDLGWIHPTCAVHALESHRTGAALAQS